MILSSRKERTRGLVRRGVSHTFTSSHIEERNRKGISCWTDWRECEWPIAVCTLSKREETSEEREEEEQKRTREEKRREVWLVYQIKSTNGRFIINTRLYGTVRYWPWNTIGKVSPGTAQVPLCGDSLPKSLRRGCTFYVTVLVRFRPCNMETSRPISVSAALLHFIFSTALCTIATTTTTTTEYSVQIQEQLTDGTCVDILIIVMIF